MHMNLLVSACLLGVTCRYDGEGKEYPGVKELLKDHHLVPVCPEILGGLPTPRTPAECRAGKVLTKTGNDVTAEYEQGAREALKLAALLDCRAAILKERSPSCGKGRIYDGTFSGSLTEGDGVCARLLEENGIKVYGESQIEAFQREFMDKEKKEEGR